MLLRAGCEAGSRSGRSGVISPDLSVEGSTAAIGRLEYYVRQLVPAVDARHVAKDMITNNDLLSTITTTG